MKKYHKKCWNCGSSNMVSRGDYSQCLDCGATYNDTPRLGQQELLVRDRYTGGAPREGSDTYYTPSAAVLRQAARARGEAK